MEDFIWPKCYKRVRSRWYLGSRKNRPLFNKNRHFFRGNSPLSLHFQSKIRITSGIFIVIWSTSHLALQNNRHCSGVNVQCSPFVFVSRKVKKKVPSLKVMTEFDGHARWKQRAKDAILYRNSHQQRRADLFIIEWMNGILDFLVQNRRLYYRSQSFWMPKRTVYSSLLIQNPSFEIQNSSFFIQNSSF